MRRITFQNHWITKHGKKLNTQKYSNRTKKCSFDILRKNSKKFYF